MPGSTRPGRDELGESRKTGAERRRQARRAVPIMGLCLACSGAARRRLGGGGGMCDRQLVTGRQAAREARRGGRLVGGDGPFLRLMPGHRGRGRRRAILASATLRAVARRGRLMAGDALLVLQGDVLAAGGGDVGRREGEQRQRRQRQHLAVCGRPVRQGASLGGGRGGLPFIPTRSRRSDQAPARRNARIKTRGSQSLTLGYLYLAEAAPNPGCWSRFGDVQGAQGEALRTLGRS